MITENQYKELCRICDRILLAPDATFERTAISFLHIVRESPNLLRAHESLFVYKNILYRTLYTSSRLFYNFFILFWNAVKYLSSRKFGTANVKKMPERVDVLFISHFLSLSHAGMSQDFYFSNIPKQINESGYSSAIALINHTTFANKKICGIWKDDQLPRFVLSKTLGFLNEIVFVKRMVKESLSLLNLARNEPKGLLRRTLIKASLEAVSPGTISNLRLSKQVHFLVSSLRPKAIIITHEGHAYERIILSTARQVIPEIKCIAYQHAILFRLQHGIFRNLQKVYNPDIILTSGLNGKIRLNILTELMKIPIDILGSNRGFTLENKNSKNDELLEMKASPLKNCCLVIPEGNRLESDFTLNFAKKCAELCPDIVFIWRLHPLQTVSSLMKQNSNLRSLPNNIIISNETLEKDLNSCRWVLYRGTTAIIQAVLFGLQPIYISKLGEMTIDPLYAVNGFKLIVASPEEFTKNIDLKKINIGEIESNAQKELQSHCENFFAKISSNILTDFLN